MVSDERIKNNYSLNTEVITRFLKLLAENGNVSMSAKMVGMNRRSIYKFAERCSEFRGAMREAQAEAKELLIGEARRRAVQGVQEDIYYQGQPCGQVTKYSDALLALLIRGHYGIPHPSTTNLNMLDDIQLHQQSIDDEENEEYDFSLLSDDEIDQLDSLLTKCLQQS